MRVRTRHSISSGGSGSDAAVDVEAEGLKSGDVIAGAGGCKASRGDARLETASRCDALSSADSTGFRTSVLLLSVLASRSRRGA